MNFIKIIIQKTFFSLNFQALILRNEEFAYALLYYVDADLIDDSRTQDLWFDIKELVKKLYEHIDFERNSDFRVHPPYRKNMHEQDGKLSNRQVAYIIYNEGLLYSFESYESVDKIQKSIIINN